MRGTTAVTAAFLIVSACASRPPSVGVSAGLVWPPAGLSSPGEVVFRGTVAEMKAGGVVGVLRAIAGAREEGTAATLTRPVAVAVAGGRLWIADSVRQAVSVSGLDGGSASFLSLPEGFRPIALAAAPGGREVWVVDGGTPRLRAYTRDGQFLREVALPKGAERCGGAAVAENGDLIVTEIRAGEVLRLDAGGALVARAGRRGDGESEFNFPASVAVAPDGTVWVVDSFNFRVRHLSAGLRPLGGFGELGDGSGHFALPKGLAIDPDGHVYVADARLDVVQVFDAEGRLLLVVGRHGAGPGEFSNPAGLACDGDGNLAIADTGNRRVQVFEYRRRPTP